MSQIKRFSLHPSVKRAEFQTETLPFDLNYVVHRARMRKGDLPIAIPIEQEIATYNDLLDFLGKEFRIKNMHLLGPPKWQGQMV